MTLPVSTSPFRHLPNLISALRLLMALPLGWAIQHGDFGLALILMLTAGLSDLLDGFLAKRMGWQSALGAWLDPAADKMLSLVVLLSLLAAGVLPLWFALVVFGRDLILALGSLAFHWLVAPLKPAPTALGRSAAFAQVLLAFFLLLDRGVTPVPADSLRIMMNIAAAVTALSAFDYIFRFALKTRDHWRQRAH